MVEIAEEFVEAVYRGQVLVAIAEMVLAELAGGVAERFEDFGERRVFWPQPKGLPEIPTVVRPVRIGNGPVINAARPAVQLGCA
jgi:hypothetical protein